MPEVPDVLEEPLVPEVPELSEVPDVPELPVDPEPVPEPLIDPESRLRTLCHTVPDRWMMEGIGFYCGIVMRWFRDAFPDCVAYGFFPQRHMTLFEAAPLVHNADERIDVRDLGFAAGRAGFCGDFRRAGRASSQPIRPEPPNSN